MSATVVFRATPAEGPVSLVSPRPRPQLYRARGVAVGDATGGSMTMRLSWDLLRPGQIAMCRQSFATRGDGAVQDVTVQAGGVMEQGAIDNFVIKRHGGSAASAATEGVAPRFAVPIVVRQMDNAALMPYIDLIWSNNTLNTQYRWLSWWVVADLLLSTPEDILSLVSLPQQTHP